MLDHYINSNHILKKKGVDYKPGSVSRLQRDGDHFSYRSRLPWACCGLPGYLDGPSLSRLSATPFLALHRMGFTKLPGRPDTGELLPHLFTLTPPCGEAVSFLWHFP